jgi:hypothetical protein
MKDNVYVVPKKINARWELFDGYGYSEMKFTAIGAVIGILVCLLIFSIQSVFFPTRPIPIDQLPAGMEYIEAADPEIVLVDRELSQLLYMAIIVAFGAIVTLPNLKISNGLSVKEQLALSSDFKNKQQLFLFVKEKR